MQLAKLQRKNLVTKRGNILCCVSNYTGPVYWNDSSRDFIIDPTQPKENFQPENMHKLVYSSLAPRLVYHGDKEKPLTARNLCQGVDIVQGVPKKLVRFAAKTTFFNTISLIALQTAQVFLGHSVLVRSITRQV